MGKRCFWTIAPVLLSALFLWVFPAAAESESEEEETHTHSEALNIVTEDQELKEQIEKVAEGLGELHQQMAQRRKMIQSETSEAKKVAWYAELDGLRKEHDLLEGLLHELVEEATATEWTKVDEALKRAREFERHQEHAYQREEGLRERQQ